MKNLILQIAISVIVTFFFANTSSAQWSINGNSGTNPPTNFLGTTDNKALVFKTNATERMRVSNSGKVGVGVTSPAYKLDVGGDINISTGHVLRVNGKPVFTDDASLDNLLIGDFTNTTTTGTNNTAVGIGSLSHNTTGYNNTAVGASALGDNTGFENTAIGIGALSVNTSGYYNVASGGAALYFNNIGYYNTASGEVALYNNTSGIGNTAAGGFSLGSNTTGSNNTGIGLYADVSSGNLSNATSLGSGAVATASNQVMLGNTSVTSVMAAGSFVIYSDGRFKKNIKEDVPGLEFIKALRPITYNYDIHGLNNHIRGSLKLDPKSQTTIADESAIEAKEKITYTGFIAQEVDDEAKKIGYDFSGVHHPANDNDVYGLSYADFVVPLVKAVQELSKQNDDLKKEVEEMKTTISTQQSSTSDGILKLSTSNPDKSGQPETLLGQNIPNPFGNSTLIPFRIPKNCHDASIMIANTSTSEVLSVIPISCNEDHVSIDAGILASGTYSYSLYVDGKVNDTKQMVLAK
jgi:trimeric autotransporter adhesin